MQAGLRRSQTIPSVGEARGIGLVGGVELVAEKPRSGPLTRPRCRRDSWRSAASITA